jgi:lipopolysaccharide/colanic/teichoic acid biosynthesis glycosyltransferase
MKQLMSNDPNIPQDNALIALINFDEAMSVLIASCDLPGKQLIFFKNGMELVNSWSKQHLNIVMVIAHGEILGPQGISFVKSLQKKEYKPVPFLLVCNHLGNDSRKLALSVGITDVFLLPLKKTNIETRVNFLIEHYDGLQNTQKLHTAIVYRLPLIKRLFDLFFAGLALLLLSPLFLVIYLLIRIGSKGPAFYYSLRVGTGYRVFKFYKFRSMYVDADKRLKDLKHLNQYSPTADDGAEEVRTGIVLCDECVAAGTKCRFPVYADQVSWCEKEYMSNRKTAAGSAFFKLKDDPRITTIGKFIRNTSIDVIIGDMSIVGNRPLPLYEAEKLTTDKYALRFTAPAGITGLWQVEKRGKGEMSEEERLLLDNKYALNHSFLNDIKLICRTIPALFQKENV